MNLTRQMHSDCKKRFFAMFFASCDLLHSIIIILKLNSDCYE